MKYEEKNCDTCKHYDTYFDCSQCEDFDEWEEDNKEIKSIISETIRLKIEIRKLNKKYKKNIKRMMEVINK